ncbi:MAG: hypothetical protein ACK500_06945 [Flavobacteriales bacterium]|jgi:hypothetical protein
MARSVFHVIAMLFISCAAHQGSASEWPPLTTDSLPVKDSILHKEVLKVQNQLSQISSALQHHDPERKKSADKKRVRVGLSLGYRWLSPESRDDYVMASVSPLDSTLRLTPQSGTSYLFSTSVIFNLFEPGKHKEPVIAPPASPRKTRKPSFNRRRTTGKPPGHFWRVNAEKICLVSNLNLLDFSSGQKELAFNKHIEGGLGLGYRFNDLMLLGINWEHVQVYQLHDDIKSLEGRQVNLYGLPLLSSNQLDERNEDLFYLKSLSGWSVKMIITL